MQNLIVGHSQKVQEKISAIYIVFKLILFKLHYEFEPEKDEESSPKLQKLIKHGQTLP